MYCKLGRAWACVAIVCLSLLFAVALLCWFLLLFLGAVLCRVCLLHICCRLLLVSCIVLLHVRGLCSAEGTCRGVSACCWLLAAACALFFHRMSGNACVQGLTLKEDLSRQLGRGCTVWLMSVHVVVSLPHTALVDLLNLLIP